MGAPFVLAAPERWPDAEQAHLSALLEALPPAFRLPDRRLTVTRSAAPALPDDLAAPHTIATIDRAGRHLDLRLDGLEGRIEAWIAAHPADPWAADPAGLARALVDRQVTHALAHRADRVHGWSRDPSWRALSAWRADGGAGEKNPLAFASLDGSRSPTEDVATLAEWASPAPPLPGDLAFHPGCRAPSKWGWLEDAAGPLPDPGPCGIPGDLDPDRVAAIEVIYVRASARSPSTLAGHMGLVVEYAPNALGFVEREAFTLAARVDGSEAGFLYNLRGLTGGFPSVVVPEPWGRLTGRYTSGEDRDVLRYRLMLDAEQERRALARLDELRDGWRRPYLFLTRNCTQLPQEVAAAALGHPVRIPGLYAPDALLGALDREGLLAPIPRASLGEVATTEAAATADGLRRAQERGLPRSPALRDLRANRPERRAQGYAALASSWPASPAELDRYLAWSDAVERGALLEMRPADQAAQMGVIDALRAAKTGNRVAGREAGVDFAAAPTAREQLFEALPAAPAGRSAHTPLRQVRVGALVRDAGDGAAPWLVLATPTYEGRLGEARRYALAPGMAVTALTGELQLRAGSALEMRSRAGLLAVTRVSGARARRNAGLYGRLADVTIARGAISGFDATWVEAGGLFALRQAHDHGRHVLVSAGLSARTLASSEADSLSERMTGTGFGVPIRAEAVYGSKAQALTRVTLRGGWQPVFTWGASRRELSGAAEAGLRLGSVAGADLGLLARFAASRGGVLDPAEGAFTREGSLALVFEPF